MDDIEQRSDARRSGARSLRRRAIAPAAGVLSGALILLGSVSAASATTATPVPQATAVPLTLSGPALGWTAPSPSPAGAGRLTDDMVDSSATGLEPDLVGTVVPSFESGDLPPGSATSLFAAFRLPTTSRGLPRPAVGGTSGTAAALSASATLPWFVAPVPGPVTSAFGPRLHPILHYVRLHNGVDMTAPCGQPVVAAAAGRVSFAGRNGGYGNLVVVDHGLRDGQRLQTKYAHLSVIGVRVGQAVTPGVGVGLAGTTGLSTGCHLHFEVKSNGVYVNPVSFLTGKPAPAPIAPIVAVPGTSTLGMLVVGTPTPTPTLRTTATPTPTATGTAKPTATAKPSPTASSAPKPTATAKPTVSPTAAPTTPPPAPDPDPTTPAPDPDPTTPPPDPEPTTPEPEPEPEPTTASPEPTSEPAAASPTPSGDPEEG